MHISQKHATRENKNRDLAKRNGLFIPRPLSVESDTFSVPEELTKQISQLQSVFPQAAFFAGDDDFFGPVVTLVYKNDATSKLCTISVTKFGCNVFENLMLDSSSRFWPACENLTPEFRDSNVRRALAITNLKNYNKLWKNKGQVPVTLEWDETNAGYLASHMSVLLGRIPEQLGSQLLLLGLLQDQIITSTLIDVVYNNRDPEGGQQTVDENNKIVLLLGEQMNHLFDPLLEYSPQKLEYEYEAPHSSELPMIHSNEKVQAIMQELIDVQAHFMTDLVSVLQDFIIPLRIHVLNSSSNSTLGIIKVNLVFPPTIDEIARINCIAHDCLIKAQKHGYVEVFKVFSTMLPFFYNAFVRHLANLTRFHAHYSKFVDNNEEYVFGDSQVNKGGYSVRGIESVISGSIFELPRIKLLLSRLYETIVSEMANTLNLDSIDNSEVTELVQYYTVCMEIIDSFGYTETQPVKRDSRVFTPSGKLLTEIATGWPTELQYGWMDRKVVGIYQIRNVMDRNRSSNEIMIIFSDHLLFIEIENECTEQAALLLSEVLMNLLINSKPLPKFSNFPNLKVKYWCGIDNLVVREYESEREHCLSFTTFGRNHFRDKDEIMVLHVQNYLVSSELNGFVTCKKIMELITKAQAMRKSVPYHLFKNYDNKLEMLFCAHEKEEYESETSKSPVIIVLNLDQEYITHVFDKSGSAYYIYNVVFLNDHTLQLTGYSRNKSECEINEIVSIEDFGRTIREYLNQSFDDMFLSSFLSLVMRSANLQFITYFLEDDDDPARAEPQFDRCSIDMYPETSEDLYAQPVKNLKERHMQKTEKVDKSRHANRRSVFGALLNKIKKHHDAKETKESHISQPARENTTKKYPKVVPETGFPRGNKVVYKKLYSPIPHLRQSSDVSSLLVQQKTMNQPTSKQVAFVPEQIITPTVQHPIQSRNVSAYTNASSHYSEVSVDVKSESVLRAEETNLKQDIDQLRTAIESDSQAKHNSLLLDDKRYQAFMAEVSEMKAVLRLKSLDSADTLRVYETAAIVPEQKLCGHEAKSTQVPGKAIEQGRKSIKEVEANKEVKSTTKKEQTSKPIASEELKQNTLPLPKLTKRFKGELRIAENTHVELPKLQRRVLSSQDIALALEKINASGISPEVYAKYKQYDEVPVSTFYDDGEKNWVVYTRDNSSNLQTEIQAMKEEANMDTIDVIDVGSQSMLKTVTFDFSGDTNSTAECVPNVHDHTEQETVAESLVSKEESVQSLTSGDFLNDFEKRLECGFHLNSEASLDKIFKETEATRLRRFSTPNAIPELEAAQNRKPSETSKALEESAEAITERTTNTIEMSGSRSDLVIVRDGNKSSSSTILLGTPSMSSEDEYFTSDDFAAFDYYNQLAKDENDTITSSSSDKTLMNEWATTKDTNDIESVGFRQESIALLSDILNGNVSF